MNTIRGVVRFLLGLVFLFSGFVKLIDPVGSGMIMDEYLKFMHLSFLSFGADSGASFLSALEMLTGIVLLTGFRIKNAIVVSLSLLSFFTFLTLFLAIYNPIVDCGCFGEAIKLTNLETFLKNIVLLGMALFLYLQKDNFVPVAPGRIEWVFTIIFALLVILLSVYSHYNLPIVDFLEYKAGYDLKENTIQESVSAPEFETILIYTKNGEKKEFSINSLPDSSWTFYDSKTTKMTKGKSGWSASDFAITNSSGEYITDSVLNIKEPVFIFTILKSWKLSDKTLNLISANLQKFGNLNIKSIILTSSLPNEVSAKLKQVSVYDKVYFTDFKTLVAMNRANTGVIYLNDGVIVKKWIIRRFSNVNLQELTSEDPELVSARVNIRQQINVEIIIVSFIIFLVLMRFVFKLIFINKMTKYANRIEEEFKKL